MRIDNTTEEYLEAIYKFNEKKEKLNTKELADYFKIRPQSAREKLKNLSKEGYLTTNRTGIELTIKGIERAKDVIRKHRLAERFLSDILKLDWDEVHEEACLFEHTMSCKVADALEKYLDFPNTCPHGNPIPDKNGQIKTDEVQKLFTKLSSLQAGQNAIVKKIDESSSQLLRQLLSLGILPESKLHIKQIAPFRSAFLIEINNLCCYSLGREVAEKIWVTVEPATCL